MKKNKINNSHKKSSSLILETPCAVNLGYRVAFGGSDISENRLDDLLQQVAESETSRDYISVSRIVRQTGSSSGSAGREGWERLILVHDRIGMARNEDIKIIRDKLNSLLCKKVESLVNDESAWRSARGKTKVHLQTLDDWLSELKTYFPKVPLRIGKKTLPHGENDQSLKMPLKKKKVASAGEESVKIKRNIQLIMVSVLLLAAMAGVFFIGMLIGNQYTGEDARSVDPDSENLNKETFTQEFIISLEDSVVSAFRNEEYTKAIDYLEEIQEWESSRDIIRRISEVLPGALLNTINETISDIDSSDIERIKKMAKTFGKMRDVLTDKGQFFVEIKGMFEDAQKMAKSVSEDKRLYEKATKLNEEACSLYLHKIDERIIPGFMQAEIKELRKYFKEGVSGELVILGNIECEVGRNVKMQVYLNQKKQKEIVIELEEGRLIINENVELDNVSLSEPSGITIIIQSQTTFDQLEKFEKDNISFQELTDSIYISKDPKVQITLNHNLPINSWISRHFKKFGSLEWE